MKNSGDGMGDAMMQWVDESETQSRFFVAETASSLEDAGIDGVLGEVAAFLASEIAGRGNASEFDTAFLEIRCDSGRLIAALGSEDARLSGAIDGCAVRYGALQVFSYALLDAGASDDTYTRRVRDMVSRIGRRFGTALRAAELVGGASSDGLRVVVYGGDPGDVVHEAMLRSRDTTS